MTTVVRHWWTAPEPRMAGRLGLFRILYGAFYLWHLSWVDGVALGLLPAAAWEPVDLLRLVPPQPLGAAPGAIESCLVAGLVLVLVGRWVRAATLAVLVLGTLLEAVHQSFGKVEHATVFLVVYLPLFMLGSAWGDTWSLDALAARRAGRPVTHPADDSWRHALPMRAALLVLSLLFLSAAVAKAVVGDWLTAGDLVANLLLGKNVEAVRQGLPPTAISPVVAADPLLSDAFRYGVLVFEGAFGVTLLGGRVRATYLAAALAFHALSALLLIVTFTPILVVYGLFVDWQGLVERLPAGPSRIARRLERLPPPVASASALALAAMVGWAWNLTPTLRTAVQLGGHFDWRTIWYPVLPLALAWGLGSAVALAKSWRAPRRAPG